MKVPRRVKMYSPYAKKHTIHEIEVVKKKRASELARGQRLFRRVTSGYGGFPRPKPEGREKPTKRVYVRYRCTETCLLYTSPSPRDQRGTRMPSSA